MKRSLYTYVDVMRSRRIHRRHGHARRARLSVGVRQTAIDVHLRPTSRLHTHARRHHHTRRTMTSQRSRDTRSLGAGARTVLRARGRRRRRRLRPSVSHRRSSPSRRGVDQSGTRAASTGPDTSGLYSTRLAAPPTDRPKRRDAPLWLLIRPGFAAVVVAAAKSFPRRPPWNRATTTTTRRP